MFQEITCYREKVLGIKKNPILKITCKYKAKINRTYGLLRILYDTQ